MNDARVSKALCEINSMSSSQAEQSGAADKDK